MTNLEKMWKMSDYEFAEWYAKHIVCELCEYNDGCPNKDTGNPLLVRVDKCVEQILSGLNKEINPLPTLETGDIVETDSFDYVATGTILLVNPSKRNRETLYNVRDSIRRVRRWRNNEYVIIWRRDNGTTLA